MAQLQASRTLVKSPPELWAECSDAGSLVRHLGAFGEIRIAKLEPETAVAWEGDEVSGTVTLEPSGWGTRVTLTAHGEVAVEPDTIIRAPTLGVPALPEPPRSSRWISRWLGRWRPTPIKPGVPVEIIERAEADAQGDDLRRPRPGQEALDAALDSLGTAHRRPFSHA